MASEAERKAIIEDNKALNRELEQQKALAILIGDMETARARQSEIIANNEATIKSLKEDINDLTEDEKKLLESLEKTQKSIVTVVENETKSRKRLNAVVGETWRQIKLGLGYLQQSDKIIRSTILSLGMSGQKAELMRGSFEQSAGIVARMGGSLEDIQSVMTGYADETGRARVMSSQMVQDIVAIGKGTGLGVEQATRLGAQFELMGFDAKSTMDYVQGVVDTSERMGVNTTKVLKNVNDNFKRLNTYTFQQGVKGFAQMAMYAEKFRIDIGQALNAADVARSLEGAIDLAANLQIMGGEFAKTDPFEMLFLSRNDPAKFSEKIADMTKGVVTFRKMADGSFEKFISPADRDRLASVAKSLGMEASALTEMAERQAEIQKMRQQMAGMGLSAKEKEIIEGAAIFNKETGKFEVQLAGKMKDIATLTKEQASAFAIESKSLKDRALEAQTFEDALKATMNELKSALLPILKAINGLLTWARPVVIKITEFLTGNKFLPGWVKVAGLFLSAGALWKGILQPGAERIGKATVGKLAGRIRGAEIPPPTGSVSGLAEQRRGIGAGAAAKGAGMKSLGAGAGIGAAALGIGAGIGLAATGISKLAEAMSKLDRTQIWALPVTVLALAAAFAVFTPAIIAVGTAGTVSAPGLLALGGAVLGIGAGIGIAAAGVGFMGQGLAKLVTASKDAGPAMKDVGKGIGMVSLAMLGFSAGAAGFLVFSGTMNKIAKNAPALAAVGDSFKQINAVLSGSKEDYIAIQHAVESIANANIKGGGMFADLANILNKPLKVEFAQGRVAMVNDITLNLDGQKFMQKAYNVNLAIQKHNDLRSGKGDVI